jgi:non-canonical purine NTP pyrophosphatase (RdgB/HAM1 family)
MKIYLASGNAHKVQEFQAIADTAKATGGVAVEFVSAKAVGGMPEVVEDTGTFIGNARKKAQALKAKLMAGASPDFHDTIWVLADDSGLCVDALGGAPGVESAYYAGPQGDPAANLRKLVEVMRGVPAKGGDEHPTSNIEQPTSNDGGTASGAGGAENAQRSTLNAEHLSGGDSVCAGGPPMLPAKANAGRGAHFLCVLVLLGPSGVEQVFEGRCEGTLLIEPRGGAGFGYDPLFVPEGKNESLAEMGEALKNQLSHRARAAQRLMAWWLGRS